MKFLADENFNNQIVRGILRRNPTVDIERIQDVGLSGVDDPTVLAWAAEVDRVTLTHDVSTMAGFAYDRVKAGLKMPGLVEVSRRVAVSVAIDDILLLEECALEEELEGRVYFLPLR
ncbi:MAG: hypothetical protein BJG00_001725 [Limnothrix sp. CACIAM 69d]|nr:MAG: hypothetical protein BJG00_001725 [Limnothrix sp. CACIAM 69d]